MSKATANPELGKAERMFTSVTKFFEKGQLKMYSHGLNLWEEILKLPQFELKVDHVEFVFKHLLPSLFDKDIRGQALKSVEATMPLLLKSNYHSHPAYKTFVNETLKEYMPKVDPKTNAHWADIWCNMLTVAQKDMARSSQINRFLSVVEEGFRSDNNHTRVASFTCWRKLIEIFTSEGQLSTLKRLKLITTPLTVTASKSLDLAAAKFSCWWLLINNISTEMCEDPKVCFLHFLTFFFGPMSDVPLEGYVKSSSVVSPGKLYIEMKLPVVVAMIKILGQSFPLVDTLVLTPAVEDLKPKLDIQKVFPRCRQELIFGCAEATVLVYIMENLSPDTQATLTRNLWLNLFAVIKKDDKMLKSMILTMDVAKALVRLSEDPQYMAIRLAIPIILETIVGADFNLRKGAPLQTNFALSMARGLNAAVKVVEKSVIERFFKELVVANFESLILLDHKLAFANTVGSALLKETNKCSYLLWRQFWSEVLVKLEREDAVLIEFLKYGLDNYFNELIQEKELWVFDWRVMGKNSYLNKVAELLQTVTSDKPSSFNIVEVVTHMLDVTDQKIDKTSKPSNIFKLYNSQLERFVSTEFAETFLDSLNNFIMGITGDQFVLVLQELNETLRVLKKSSKSMSDSGGVITLRKLLQDKCALIANLPDGNVKAFLTQHKDFVSRTKTSNAADTKTTPVAKKSCDDDFVPIQREWTFNPKELTDHQIERMKERRDDIPALYNDNSQSQDSRSLQPWVPKSTVSEPLTRSGATSVIVAAPEKGIDTATFDTNTPFSVFTKVESTDSNSPRPDTPTNQGKSKKSRIQNELLRLAIDTVEGRNFVMDGNKTRFSRRSSVDTRVKEPRTSPRKTAEEWSRESKRVGKIHKLKSRASLALDIAEEDVVEDSKGDKVVAATDAQITAPVIDASTTSLVTDRQENAAHPKPMVTIPYEIIDTSKSASPVHISTDMEVAISNADTEAMTENLPAVEVETEDPGSPIDEMHLAVSANNSETQPRNIVSSPELENVGERESTFLNDTINISPILKDVTAPPKETLARPSTVPVEVTMSSVVAAKPDVLTTPKRSMDILASSKENQPSAVSTTPHSFLSKMNGRGAQMLQQTKLFQESTPKAKEDPTINKEDTLQRMLIKTVVPPRSSPSTSILRRKRLEESMDDTLESPATKKKKVSFSDPPVSETKEFEREGGSRAAFPKSKLHRLPRTESSASIFNGRPDYNSDSDEMEEFTRDKVPIAPIADAFEYLRQQYFEPGEDGQTQKMTISQQQTLTDVLLRGIANDEAGKEMFFRTLSLAMPKDTLHWSLKENSGYFCLNEVKKQVPPGTFNNFFLNLLKTDKEFATTITKDINRRMDPMQKLEFIAAISTELEEKK